MPADLPDSFTKYVDENQLDHIEPGDVLLKAASVGDAELSGTVLPDELEAIGILEEDDYDTVVAKLRDARQNAHATPVIQAFAPATASASATEAPTTGDVKAKLSKVLEWMGEK